MDNFKESDKVDPDYESYNSALEVNKEEDKEKNFLKLKKIIEEEYSNEILQREEQIENIELQLCKVRKLLHLLRYVLIMSYYKKKELEYSGPEDETTDGFPSDSKQSRIHPAIKKLLGKDNNLEHLNLKAKRKSHARSKPVSSQKNIDIFEPESKRIKLEAPIKKEIVENFTSREERLESISKRKKTKHRIIVGNISKWMPSLEDDNLTHKWMVYVRGPKEIPDVSHFIEKVVFYLHPSYKPYDVVEVNESPFHLARRGWGEFPVRVQIFFKVTLNKPIDIVHSIKLDKTYTGRQTLGSETIVDVFLYDNKTENVELKAPVIKSERASTSSEHDYCDNIKLDTIIETEEIEAEHSYSLSPTMEHLPKIKSEPIVQDETNKLIHGLDNYLEGDLKVANISRTSKVLIPLSTLSKFMQLNRKDVIFNNIKIIDYGRKIDGSFTSTLNPLLGENFQISVPNELFKNMGEALSFVFKKLPLFSDLAKNFNYKLLYPFTAPTLKDFVSWNVGKRRSSEWTRALTIKHILAKENIYGADQWSTKAILMYGRSHDFSPFTTFGLFTRKSAEKELILNVFSNNPVGGCKFSLANCLERESDITVDVDSDTEASTSPKKNTKSKIDVSDKNLKLECAYVRQSALDCGIMLKSEEIEEGVMLNGAERMIFEAVKSLADNLIRRAKNYKVCTKTLSQSANTISLGDVQMALNERQELQSLMTFKRERKNMEYFF